MMFWASCRRGLKFEYKGKPITIIYALNCGGGELWSPVEHIKESDLIVFHDGIYDIDDNRATKFISNVAVYGKKKRVILSENQWNLPKKDGTTMFDEKIFKYTYFNGPYGCEGSHYVFDSALRIIGNKIIADDRPPKNKNLNLPLKPYAHSWLPNGAILIEIEKQK